MNDTNITQNVTSSESKKKTTKTAEQIRKYFMRKMPNHRESIRTLTDEECQAIWEESKEKKRNTPSKDKKSNNANHYPEEFDSSTKKNVENILNMKNKVQVFEGVDEKRHKKMRTVVLVHQEMDDSEDEHQAPTKMKKTSQGIVRSCTCDCCKKLDNVNELLSRLGTLLDEKKSE